MEIYQKTNNNWFHSQIWLEHELVLTYEIYPEQVIFAIKLNKRWFTIFRDKWSKRIKFIKINGNK